jgi:parallel beta-helix repeat protein
MQTLRTAMFIAVAALLAACTVHPDLAIPPKALEIHVTPATAGLKQARDSIREWKRQGQDLSSGVTVWFHAGTYSLAEPFALTAEDSGTKGGPIVYRAVEGEDVTFSAGKVILGWKPYRGTILRVDVSDLDLDKLPAVARNPIRHFELFYRGVRMELARWPNRDPESPAAGEWAYIADATGDSKTEFTVLADSNRLQQWELAPDAQIHTFPHYDWRDFYRGIDHVDINTGKITVTSPVSYAFQPGRRYYVRNVFQELDAPGEWYFDAKTETIYFQPPGPIEDGDVVVSYGERAITLDSVSHVTFQGITFEHTLKEAVRIEHGEGNRIVGCTVRNTGGSGIAVKGGRDNAIIGCDISYTGLGGILLHGGDRATLTPANNSVENCHIHHYSRLVKTYNTAVNIHGVGNKVRHNLIHDAPHTAILLHGNEHLVEYNEIHNVLEETQDAGAFYVGRDWTARGNIVRYNYFHDLYGYGLTEGHASMGLVGYGSPASTWAVYLDDCASGTAVYGNLFVRCTMGALHLGGGRDNRFENNIIVEGYPAAHTDARWTEFFMEDSAGGVATYMRNLMKAANYRKPPYSERYPELVNHYDDDVRIPRRNVIRRNIVSYRRDNFAGFWSAAERPASSVVWQFHDYDPETFIVDSNLVWHHGQPVRVDQSPYMKKRTVTTWNTWRSLGYDVNSVVADPGFADPGADDYTLARNSPAWALGFERIPVEKIGIYANKLRATWPVDRALRRRSDLHRKYTFQLFDIDTQGSWNFAKQVEIAGPYPLDWDGTWIDTSKNILSRAHGFDAPLPPESGTEVDWQVFNADKFRYFDFTTTFSKTDNLICFARITINAPKEMDTRLSIGSNDGVKVWLNGKLVREAWTARGAEPHQDIVPIHLRSGQNEILAKVANIGGGWGLILAIEDPKRALRWSVERLAR